MKISHTCININTPIVLSGNLSGDNAQFTENTVTTIKSHQLNLSLDGQEATIQAGSVIPTNMVKLCWNYVGLGLL